jgi:hypothetical protein
VGRPEAREGVTEDLWALRRAEQLLEGLTGVISAKIVAGPTGEIEEIHVLTRPDVAPKQTVRNVESALLAHLGIKVDHRKISVAQTKEGASAAHEPVPAVTVLGGRKYLYEGFEIERQLRHRILCRVRLRSEGQEYVGTAEGADVPRVRIETAARALLDALETGEQRRVSLALDGAKMVHVFDRDIVVVGVYGISGRSRTFLAGACPVSESPEQAAILAALQATNRWITQP